MYAKFLFVGLGGSGGKTLRFLKRELTRWQTEHGIGGPLPRGWQFVNIDTPAIPDGAELDDVVEPLPADEYVGLSDGAVTFKAVQDTLDVKAGHHYELCGWRPDTAGPAGSVDLLIGAGQYRAVGQTVALAYASRISRELQKRWGRLTEPDTDAQLGKVFKQVTGKAPRQESNVYVVVVSSLAGGTGAGLLGTVCDILRASQLPDGAGQRAFALLYTPDVFDTLEGAVTDGIQANTLAAACELMNGAWRNSNDPAPLPDPVLQNAGLIPNSSKRGPAYPFLVGRQNSDGIAFSTPEQVFEMTGRSIVSWVTDITVQDELIAYTIAGWTAFADAMPMGDKTLVDAGGTARGLPLFQALGFARVSLGTDYLEDYVVKRLAKDANEQLAEYHVKSDEAQRAYEDLGTADQDMISREIASEYRDSFLHDAGLLEYGENQNEIIDALRPDNALAEEFERRARALTDITDADMKLRKTVHDWTLDINQAVEEELKAYNTSYQDALDDSTRRWVETVEGSVLDAIEKHLARRGLHVAKSLCELAAEHLASEVAHELRDESQTWRDWHSNWNREARRVLDGVEGKVTSHSSRVDEALRMAVHFATFVGEMHLRERAAELCEQIAQRVLEPLARELSEAHAAAASDTPDTQTWPAYNDNAPPKSFEPPLSEFTVIGAAEFPRLFKERLKQTFPKATVDGRRTSVRDEVIIGGFLKSEPDTTDAGYNEVRCLAALGNWWPHTKRVIDPSRNPSRLRVRAHTRIDDLQSRARRWLRQQGSPFDRLLSHGIRSYLGDDGLFDDGFTPAEIEGHRTEFLAQLGAAIKASGPLVNINTALLGIVHPDNPNTSHRRKFSQIPLQAHPAGDDVGKLLANGGLPDAETKRVLTNDPSVKHVHVTSLLHAPHSILVMESLTHPVAAAWNRAKGTPAGLDSFWRCRRGKRLDKFVPVPQPLLLCMIRGWFTGIALGCVDKGTGSEPATIRREHGGTPAPFPYPLLSPISDECDTLACLMEALGLAYMEAGAMDDLGPLDAYRELRDLGLAGAGPDDLYEYRRPNAALQRWIDGKHVEGITQPLQELGESVPQSADQRAKVVADLFEGFRHDYEERYNLESQEWSNDARKLTRAPLWTGMWVPVSIALEHLSRACRQIEAMSRRGSTISGISRT